MSDYRTARPRLNWAALVLLASIGMLALVAAMFLIGPRDQLARAYSADVAPDRPIEAVLLTADSCDVGLFEVRDATAVEHAVPVTDTVTDGDVLCGTSELSSADVSLFEFDASDETVHGFVTAITPAPQSDSDYEFFGIAPMEAAE